MKKLGILFLGLLLLFCRTVCFASVADGDMSLNEGAQEYVLTEEDKLLLEQKELKMKEYLAEANEAKSYPYTKTISVPCYLQSETYFCGPATVKEVVQFKKGTSKTQYQYSYDLGTTAAGTDMTIIPGVINAELGANIYVYYSFLNQTDWLGKVVYSTNTSTPVILDINTTAVSEIPYNTTGHFLPVSGYHQNASGVHDQIRVADPHYAYCGSAWYSVSGLYTACYNHWRKAIIW